MAQKDPEKKMPSTTAKATSRSANELDDEIHRMAHSALALTHGTSSSALKSLALSSASRTYVSMSSEYISLWMFSMAI